MEEKGGRFSVRLLSTAEPLQTIGQMVRFFFASQLPHRFASLAAFRSLVSFVAAWELGLHYWGVWLVPKDVQIYFDAVVGADDVE